MGTNVKIWSWQLFSVSLKKLLSTSIFHSLFLSVFSRWNRVPSLICISPPPLKSKRNIPLFLRYWQWTLNTSIFSFSFISIFLPFSHWNQVCFWYILSFFHEIKTEYSIIYWQLVTIRGTGRIITTYMHKMAYIKYFGKNSYKLKCSHRV